MEVGEAVAVFIAYLGEDTVETSWEGLSLKWGWWREAPYQAHAAPAAATAEQHGGQQHGQQHEQQHGQQHGQYHERKCLPR